MDDQKGTSATRAKNKYNSKNYDNLRIVVHKGRKADIQAYADAAGQSLNAYVIDAVETRMAQENIPATEKKTGISDLSVSEAPE